MTTVLITGGSGLIGRSLCKFLLERNFQVIILTRDKGKLLKGLKTGSLRYCWWDPETSQMDPDALLNTQVIVHLAGAGIADHRWTPSRKKEILESRIASGLLLFESLKKYPYTVKTILSASAIGYYGEGTDRIFEESDGWSPDFLGTTCSLWEHQMEPIRLSGIRVMILRFGIVLSREGGLLKFLSRPISAGIAPIPGSGNQWVSWIHILDICRIIHHGISDGVMEGTFNAVAPQPSTFKELVQTIALVRRGKKYLSLPVPSTILKIMFGEMSLEILKSCRVSCQKLIRSGYTFAYPQLQEALEDLFPD